MSSQILQVCFCTYLYLYLALCKVYRIYVCFLHLISRDCLSGQVEHADTPEVKCPYQDDQYACSAALQEREIKAVSKTIIVKNVKSIVRV